MQHPRNAKTKKDVPWPREHVPKEMRTARVEKHVLGAVEEARPAS
jgi:hypothetical protein